MYARTTTLRADLQSMDQGIAHVRDEVLPAVREMDGCVGLSMLVDRGSGRCIVTTSWETEEAMAAARERVRDMRERAAQMLGGSQPEVREWEVAVLHRAHHVPEGACARITWTRIDPQKSEQVLDAYKMALMPRIEEIPGFCANSLLIDRREGLGAGAVVLDSRDALERSRDMGRQMREEFTRRMGAEILDVGEFEVALAHLRVPETV